jgi:hypothetical protein
MTKALGGPRSRQSSSPCRALSIGMARRNGLNELSRAWFAPELAASLLRLQQQTPYNQPNDWVFASMKTRGRSPVWLSTLMDDHVEPAVVRAKVQKRVTWHVFRHTFATLLKAKGEDIKTLQESLRHSTVSMSMETYAHAVPQNIRAAHGGWSIRSSPQLTREEVPQCIENKGNSLLTLPDCSQIFRAML